MDYFEFIRDFPAYTSCIDIGLVFFFDLPKGWLGVFLYFLSCLEEGIITQVCNKMGGLRIDLLNGTPKDKALVWEVYRLSQSVCCECASNKKVEMVNDGLIRPLCVECK